MYRLSTCSSSYAGWKLSLLSSHGWASSCFHVLNFHLCASMLQVIWEGTWEPQFPFQSPLSVLLRGTCPLLTCSRDHQATKLSPFRGHWNTGVGMEKWMTWQQRNLSAPTILGDNIYRGLNGEVGYDNFWWCTFCSVTQKKFKRIGWQEKSHSVYSLMWTRILSGTLKKEEKYK